MKKFILIILLIFTFTLVSCNNKEEVKVYHTIDVYDTNDNLIQSFDVEDGTDFVLPTLEIEAEGYYYANQFEDSELKNITTDKILYVKKTQYQKVVSFVIDNEEVLNYNGRYHETLRYPSFDSSMMESYEWLESKKLDNGIYYFTYTLSYVKKTTYNIKFYDGATLLDLGMDKYKIGETTTLPTYTKEGYEFIGWFVSDISLARYTEISSDTLGDIKLYARFIETVKHETFTLSQASDHFTGVNKVQDNPTTVVMQPKLPTSAKSAAPTQYDWTTSDASVATISTYSSISIQSAGYVVITATLKTDSSYTINGVFKTTAEGIFLSSEEEANTISLVNVTFKDKDGKTIYTQKVNQGGSVIAPTPTTYDDYAFIGWDHETYNIKEDTVFTAQYAQGLTNRFVGKTISFLGDSLTSYLSNIPEGFASFFPYPTADIYDVNMMWYMQIINKLGAKMFINDSMGGTCVMGGSEPTSSDSRLKHLKVGEQYADVLIIYMGHNDCAANKKYPTEYSKENFQAAYTTMIEKIKALCPNTEILCCTMGLSNLYTNEAKTSFNEAIRTVASNFGLEVLELESLDLTVSTGTKLLVDSGHPTYAGMKLVVDALYKNLVK